VWDRTFDKGRQEVDPVAVVDAVGVRFERTEALIDGLIGRPGGPGMEAGFGAQRMGIGGTESDDTVAVIDVKKIFVLFDFSGVGAMIKKVFAVSVLGKGLEGVMCAGITPGEDAVIVRDTLAAEIRTQRRKQSGKAVAYIEVDGVVHVGLVAATEFEAQQSGFDPHLRDCAFMQVHIGGRAAEVVDLYRVDPHEEICGTQGLGAKHIYTTAVLCR